MNDCINERTDEFIKLITEKIHITKIHNIIILLSYPGRKKAIHTAKINIKIHKINLRLITLEITFDALL